MTANGEALSTFIDSAPPGEVGRSKWQLTIDDQAN